MRAFGPALGLVTAGLLLLGAALFGLLPDLAVWLAAGFLVLGASVVVMSFALTRRRRPSPPTTGRTG